MDFGAEEAAAELAVDGVWMVRQLEARRRAWGLADMSGLVDRVGVAVRPTAFSRRMVRTGLVRLNRRGEAAAVLGVRPVRVRGAELEHALGAAELRFAWGTRWWELEPCVNGAGDGRRWAGGRTALREHVADGAVRTPHGLVLLEDDHGGYSARQVLEKVASQSEPVWRGLRVAGAVWGAPTECRAAWLT